MSIKPRIGRGAVRAATAAAGTVAALAGALSMQTPAHAAYDQVTCTTTTSCATRPIEAHNSEHWIRIKVYSGTYHSVRDMDTGVIVSQGTGTGNQWHTIPGLYGERYRLYVTAVPVGVTVRGIIANCTSGCRNP